MIEAARYVGLRFVDGGRDRKGCDCWGLVRLVLGEARGIEVPSYGEISAIDLAAVALEVERGVASETWVQATAPRELDVAVLFARTRDRKRRPSHCGIMLDHRRLLHIEANTDSVVVPIDHVSVKHRIFGFFRHRELA